MPSGTPFDEADQELFLSHVADGHHPAIAAELTGFTWKTVKRHLESNALFAHSLGEAQDRSSALIEDILYEEAKAGNLGAIKMWLHNRVPNRWRDEQVLRKEISGPDGGPITVVQANVAALREVLTDDDTRLGALQLVQALPAASREAE